MRAGPLCRYIGAYMELLLIIQNRDGGGRVVRWFWVSFQCRGVLLIWILVGQGPTVLTVGAGGIVWTFFSLFFLLLSGRRPDID